MEMQQKNPPPLRQKSRCAVAAAGPKKGGTHRLTRPIDFHLFQHPIPSRTGFNDFQSQQGRHVHGGIRALQTRIDSFHPPEQCKDRQDLQPKPEAFADDHPGRGEVVPRAPGQIRQLLPNRC